MNCAQGGNAGESYWERELFTNLLTRSVYFSSARGTESICARVCDAARDWRKPHKTYLAMKFLCLNHLSSA